MPPLIDDDDGGNDDNDDDSGGGGGGGDDDDDDGDIDEDNRTTSVMITMVLGISDVRKTTNFVTNPLSEEEKSKSTGNGSELASPLTILREPRSAAVVRLKATTRAVEKNGM
ncbi:hypothetical protein PoB_002064700 [Plakobranchus ocellatus]|uniref:Uncharacterized protein n=1 Tax=Plakobranchus ocellatus TaxID=259542 RepID=A0AAV3ZFQ2_9GAST|nr:hypothetical protein PoB_002064700 [Plakobranchus ocellatus]